MPDLRPNRPKPPDDELTGAMRLVSVALTESRFAGEAWLPADPSQRTIEKPAWLAFAEQQRLSRNAGEWAIYRLAELGLIEVVWPRHEQLAQGRDTSVLTAQASRYRGGREPTVCDWDLFEDGRVLTIRSFPGLWDFAHSVSCATAATPPDGDAPLPTLSDVATAERVVIDYVRQAIASNKGAIASNALADYLKARGLEPHLTAVTLALEARGVLIPGPSEPPTSIPRSKNGRALGVLIIQRGGPSWWRIGPGAVEYLRSTEDAAQPEVKRPTDGVKARNGGTPPIEPLPKTPAHAGSSNKLLAAVRELGAALRTKVPYPGRPGQHCIDLSDGRADSIQAELQRAVVGPIDALPPGAATRLAELLRDLHNLRFRELDDPNGLHLRALDLTREIEAALAMLGGGARKDERTKTAGAPFVPLTSWRDIVAALNGLHEPHAGKATWKNDESTRDKIRKLNLQHNGPIKLPTGKGKQPSVDKAALLVWWAGLREHFDARTDEEKAAAESAEYTTADGHKFGASATVVPGIGGSVKRTRTGTGKKGKEGEG